MNGKDKNNKNDNKILDFESLDLKEKDNITNDILKDSKEIKIPSSIEPDNIKKLLADNNNIKKYEHKKMKKNSIAMAACVMLLISTTMYLKTNNYSNLRKEKFNITSNLTVTSYDDVYYAIKDIDEYNKDAEKTGLWDYISNLLNGKILESEKKTTSSNEIYRVEDSSDSLSKESTGSNSGVSTKTSNEYSKTNTQVDGIDEGDIIKNDGSYLYCFTKDNSKYSYNNVYYDDTTKDKNDKYFGDICIVKAENGKLKLSSKIQLKNAFSEFYIKEDKLIIISQKYVYDTYRSDDYTNEEYIKDCVYNDYSGETIIDVYDISDRTKPVLIKTLSQDGSYGSSRINNGYVYLFSRYTIASDYKKDDIATYIPNVNDKAIDASSIYIPDNTCTKSFLILTSIKLTDCDKFCSEQAIMSNCSNYYVSNNNIYVYDLCRFNKRDNCNYTSISKFGYEDGKIIFKKSRSICGEINNSFSMDEYEDNLRVVTTVRYYDGSNETNSLTVLDSNFEIIGTIDDIAPDEDIKSARFMGDYGYFVTFRNMDPLFAVDLSNPSKPKILSELKITGFSSYLHFYSDNLLLGIGEEIDPYTLEPKGIKLSMFDISDPSNVTEINKLVLDKYDDTDALNEYKSVMIDTEKNLFGFYLMGYNYNEEIIKREDYDSEKDYYTALSEYQKFSDIYHYQTFSYDVHKGFVTKLDIDLKKDFLMDSLHNYSFRGTYINNTLYVISDKGKIISYNLEDGKKLNNLEIY